MKNKRSWHVLGCLMLAVTLLVLNSCGGGGGSTPRHELLSSLRFPATHSQRIQLPALSEDDDCIKFS
jgi:hypothetical protein